MIKLKIDKVVYPVKSRKAGISPKAKLFNRVNLGFLKYTQKTEKKPITTNFIGVRARVG